MPAPIRRAQLADDVPLASTKDPCRLATTVNDTLSGLAARDGVSPVAGDRMLVKAQSTGSQNGIYVAAAGAWTRADDFATDEDADPGTLVPVSEGTANADTVWQLTTNAPITLGATNLTFSIVSRAGVDPGAHGTSHDPGGSDPVTTAVAIGLNANSANAEGTATSLARSDHSHNIDTAGGTISTIQAGDSAVEGTGTGVARRDHQHAVATGAPSQGIGGGNAEGSSSNLARADHNHAIREAGGPTDLTVGAIADGEFFKRSGASIVGMAIGAGLGDVVGPAGATDNGIARYDGATGKLIQDTSGPKVEDDGRISSLTAGTGATDAVNKAQLDAVAGSGVVFKTQVRFATDAALPANTPAGSGIGKTLTADANGALSVDGVTPNNGDRILVKNEGGGTSIHNGSYTVTQVGDAGNPWILTRTTDFDEDAEVLASNGFWVEEGTNNGDSGWTLTTDNPITVDTTALTFTLFASAGQTIAGDALDKTGNRIDVKVDNTSIEVVGDQLAVKEINDTQHGSRGGGGLHSLATGGTAGFMSAADKTKLDGVASGATANVPRQESVTTENITNSDTPLSDTLDNAPISNASVTLFLNGIEQKQGAGADYTIAGQTITWLASTGTAINMKTSDTLEATYDSAS